MPSYTEIGAVLGTTKQAAQNAARNYPDTPLGQRVRALLAGHPDPYPPHWREVRIRAAGHTMQGVCALIRARGPANRPDLNKASDKARGPSYRADTLRYFLGDNPKADPLAQEAAIAAVEAATGLDLRTPPTTTDPTP
jgi:AcrR family transcriptional regulator